MKNLLQRIDQSFSWMCSLSFILTIVSLSILQECSADGLVLGIHILQNKSEALNLLLVLSIVPFILLFSEFWGVKNIPLMGIVIAAADYLGLLLIMEETRNTYFVFISLFMAIMILAFMAYVVRGAQQCKPVKNFQKS
jgi:hypothetical protein